MFDVIYKKNKKGDFQAEIRGSNMLVILTLPGQGIWKQGNWVPDAKEGFYNRTKDKDIAMSMNDTCLLSLGELEQLNLTIKEAERELPSYVNGDKARERKKQWQRKVALSKLTDGDKKALGLK